MGLYIINMLSGQTLYIEPSSVVEMNNQISRLRHDEAIEKGTAT